MDEDGSEELSEDEPGALGNERAEEESVTEVDGDDSAAVKETRLEPVSEFSQLRALNLIFRYEPPLRFLHEIK